MNIDRWLESMTDDSAKAEVLKAHITQSEETKRATVNSADYQGAKYLALGVAAFVALVTGCATCEHIDRQAEIKKLQIQAEHPVPAASAAPAK